MERVLAVLNYDKADRVPIDFGSPINGIHHVTLRRLLALMGLENYPLVGNGSVMGASMILLSREMAGNVKAIELNVIKEFQEEFIKATHIPHSDEKAFENVVEKIKSLRRL